MTNPCSDPDLCIHDGFCVARSNFSLGGAAHDLPDEEVDEEHEEDNADAHVAHELPVSPPRAQHVLDATHRAGKETT